MLRYSLEERTINVICKYNRPFFHSSHKDKKRPVDALLIKFIRFRFHLAPQILSSDMHKISTMTLFNRNRTKPASVSSETRFFLAKMVAVKKALPLLFFLVFAFVKLIVS